MRILWILTMLFPVAVLAQQTNPHYRFINGRTLVPIEIRTPYIACDSAKLIEAATDQYAERQLFQGTYRLFSLNNVNSASISDGLHFIVGQKSACITRDFNMVSITKADLKTGTITIGHFDIDKSDLGRLGRTYDHLTDSQEAQPSAPKKIAPFIADFTRDYTKGTTTQQVLCPWTNIKTVSAEGPSITLRCELVERPPVEVLSAKTKALRMLGLESAPVQDKGIWSKEFTLTPQRGFDPVPGRIAIEAFLVCKDATGETEMTFALMEQVVYGNGYFCQ